MTEIEIKSAKIKDSLFCEYSYEEVVENPKHKMGGLLPDKQIKGNLTLNLNTVKDYGKL